MREDTIHLLGDCTAGITLAISAIDGLLPDIRDRALRQRLREGIQDHRQLQKQTVSMLRQYGAEEKPAGPMAKSLSWLKTNTRMAMGGDDTTAAYLVADQCDAGIKNLCRSQNRYCMASSAAVDLSRELIHCQERLSLELRPFL